MTRLVSESQTFLKYGVVGLLNNAGLYLLFVLLVTLGVSPIATAGLCYVLGVCLSYALNRRWTFKSKGGHGQDALKFLTAYGIGFLSTLVTIWVLLQWFPPEVAQVVNIGVTAVVIYCALRILRFGEGKISHAD